MARLALAFPFAALLNEMIDSYGIRVANLLHCGRTTPAR